MNTLLKYPYRILIVDDEQRDWAQHMLEALKRIVMNKNYSHLEIVVVNDKDSLVCELRKNSLFHVISCNAHIPERLGEILSVYPDEFLRQIRYYSNFPILVSYAQSYNRHNLFCASLQISETTRYLKPTGGIADDNAGPIEVLNVSDWAKRIIDYLDPDRLELSEPHERNPQLPVYQTVMGAYLQRGSELLPPPLARIIHDLNVVYMQKDEAKRIEVAQRFIAWTMRLALAQCALLCAFDAEKALPEDESMEKCLEQLIAMQSLCAQYNFCMYLSKEAITSFGEAMRCLNPTWSTLQVPLQYALDVASYWAHHPLRLDTRPCSGGEWIAALLTGIGNVPYKRHALPQGIRYSNDSIESDAIWQTVFLRNNQVDNGYDVEMSWHDWLRMEDDSSWSLCAYKHNGKRVYMPFNLLAKR